MQSMKLRFGFALVGLVALVVATTITTASLIAEPNPKAHWLYIAAIAVAWTVAISSLGRLRKMVIDQKSGSTKVQDIRPQQKDIRFVVGAPLISASVTFLIIAWLLPLDQGLRTAILILSVSMFAIGGAVVAKAIMKRKSI